MTQSGGGDYPPSVEDEAPVSAVSSAAGCTRAQCERPVWRGYWRVVRQTPR